MPKGASGYQYAWVHWPIDYILITIEVHVMGYLKFNTRVPVLFLFYSLKMTVHAKMKCHDGECTSWYLSLIRQHFRYTTTPFLNTVGRLYF